MKNKAALCIALLLTFTMLAGCGTNGESSSSPDGGASAAVTVNGDEATTELFAMDTVMTLTANGARAKEAVEAAAAEIHRLDELLSTGSDHSEVTQLNESGSLSVSSEVYTLTQKSLALYEGTDGAFDITVYPIMQLWGFDSDTPAKPADEEIKKTLEKVGSDRITLSGRSVSLGEGQKIDFGGIAKGYTSSRIMDIFAQYGVSSGIISLGGNVQCCGRKPDGSLWRCGITDPDDPQSLLGVLEVEDKAVVTSGGYERNFTDSDGTLYHHIMDPAKGYPAKSGLKSVTVVSSDGTLADGLSTACFVMGEEKALAFYEESGAQFELILATDDGRIIITKGLEGSFESEREFQVKD